MSYVSIYLKGGHNLKKEMFYERSFIEVYVFRMAYLTGCVLLEDMPYWRTCLI